MKKILVVAAALLICAPAIADDNSDLKVEILAMAEAFNDAYANNDIEAYFGMYAEDAEAWWFGERVDFDAYYDEWTNMIGSGGGVVKNEMTDVKIQIMPGNDVAIVSAFIYNETRSPDGSLESSKAFETDVWRKTDAGWKIVNLHFTVIPAEE